MPVEMEIVIDGCVSHKEGFIEPDEATIAFETLKAEIPWRQESITFKTVTVPLPRLVSWHGDPGAKYWYSGIENIPVPWTPTLSALRDKCNKVCMGEPFNSVLLNYYRSGKDSIGFHADNERDLKPDSVIATISLGTPRTFNLKSKHPGNRKTAGVILNNGSLLLMHGSCQRDWLHGISKETIPEHLNQERISLTFRTVNLR